MVPGQQRHHGGDQAHQVEYGLRHLVLLDPVGVGRRVTGKADGAVGQGHSEVDPHAAHGDDPVDHRLTANNTHRQQTSTLILIITTPVISANHAAALSSTDTLNNEE